MITCIIIEDQAPAQRILQKYIGDYANLEIKATFSDPIEALEYLKEIPVDLIFLDIHLPKLSGMDFLKILNYKPLVILTTAFHEYAVQSYDFDVLDYLLKPISFDRFKKAMERVEREYTKDEKEQKESLLVKVGYEYASVNLADILYVKSDGDYTFLHCINKKYMVNSPLKYWNEILSKQDFCQIHRSYIVSLQKIEKISSASVLIENQELPIGRKYKQVLKEKLKGKVS
ncbi:LytR/AlgR family response regulator transcription factor [Marinifilum caeruleilacunae]|jgi:DNA-binding LytR/AlgR family response regulator|uniref:Response regulator transcription factor n=1 Tax=Marinifilum caeruleilacunae TaxID=2499076 RepID=A0ABX1WWA6_9BACT|nr:response regulator transcription factor [Marinifilum caeruleilacunae]NOU60332.1 response regulator transcription factor [Marinifilum caeruleilacunae]